MISFCVINTTTSPKWVHNPIDILTLKLTSVSCNKMTTHLASSNFSIIDFILCFLLFFLLFSSTTGWAFFRLRIRIDLRTTACALPCCFGFAIRSWNRIYMAAGVTIIHLSTHFESSLCVCMMNEALHGKYRNHKVEKSKGKNMSA